MTTQLVDIGSEKARIRKAALTARKMSKTQSANIAACGHLTNLIGSEPKKSIVAGYMPIQTEIDPRASMQALHSDGYRICVPVIQGHAKPLLFREWTPHSAMIEGDFGALIPRGGDYLTPDVAIIPLVGFDYAGARLGYGGGFYDRTLGAISKTGKILKIGFAFAGQEVDEIPTDEFDQKVDMVVTENGIRLFS